MSEEKAHAKYSASGSHRWMNCPGSIALSEKAPPQRESIYAFEGTKAHEVLEKILIYCMSNQHEPLKLEMREGYLPEMVENASLAKNWILDRFKPGTELLTEKKVDASSFTTQDQFGTVDAAVIDIFDTLTVIDYKYGAGIAVEPENNTQMIYYALGLAHQYNYNFKDVELVIIQPRAWHPNGETIRTWKITIDELLSWVPKFKTAVQAAEDPFAPLKSGDWCKFCPAAPICPEIKNRALEKAQAVFDDVSGSLTVSDAKGIAIAHLPKILAATYELETWIGHVREHAYHVLERGEKIEGFKLVEKRSIRKWIDEKGIEEFAYKTYGEDAFTNPSLLSPAQFEKAFPNEKTFLKSQTVNKSSGFTLVAESDKRPAINPIETVFSEVTEPRKEDTMPRKAKKKTAKRKTKKTSKK